MDIENKIIFHLTKTMCDHPQAVFLSFADMLLEPNTTLNSVKQFIRRYPEGSTIAHDTLMRLYRSQNEERHKILEYLYINNRIHPQSRIVYKELYSDLIDH